MKRIALILLALMFLVGCGAKDKDGSDAAATSSRYIDADVDFTGKVTIVGRWQCVKEIKNGEAREVTGENTYYIFSSDGTLDAFYDGTEMIEYSGYKYNGETVTLEAGEMATILNCKVSETELRLSTADGKIETVYKRVKYE